MTHTRTDDTQVRLSGAHLRIRTRMRKGFGRVARLRRTVRTCSVHLVRRALHVLQSTIRTKRLSVVRFCIRTRGMCRGLRTCGGLRGRCRGLVTRVCGGHLWATANDNLSKASKSSNFPTIPLPIILCRELAMRSNHGS